MDVRKPDWNQFGFIASIRIALFFASIFFYIDPFLFSH